MKSGKLLVTGSLGQLGCDLMDMLSGTHDVVGVDIDDIDIRRRESVLSCLKEVRPDVVIHAAACTDVDGCESNSELAVSVNGDGTRNVARACHDIGARMIYYSTDYVFDGEKKSPYYEDDTPVPCTVYGRSKLVGEKATMEELEDYVIMRIAWVYGRHGRNFVKTMLKLGRQQIVEAGSRNSVKPLRVVDDQIGNPTWTVDIARQTARVIEQPDMQGIYHATSEGEVSWYGFAREIFKRTQEPVDIVPCTSEEFPRPARRPRRSSLENARLKAAGLNLMRDYREALAEFLEQHAGELTA